MVNILSGSPLRQEVLVDGVNQGNRVLPFVMEELGGPHCGRRNVKLQLDRKHHWFWF